MIKEMRLMTETAVENEQAEQVQAPSHRNRDRRHHRHRPVKIHPVTGQRVFTLRG